MKEYILRKLPSRNWCIFWGTTASLSALLGYDKIRKRSISKELDEKCKPFRDEPIPVWLEPNQATAFIPPTHWARFWFSSYVAGVLDSGAIEYDLSEPKSLGSTRRLVRDRIWRAKEQLPERVARQALSFFKDPSDVARDMYNPANSLIAVGSNAWREVLHGLAEGCFTDRETYTSFLVNRERTRIYNDLQEERRLEEESKKDTPNSTQDKETLIEKDIRLAIEEKNVEGEDKTIESSKSYNPHQMIMAAANNTKQKQSLYQKQQSNLPPVDTELQELYSKIDSNKLLNSDSPIDSSLYDMTKLPLNLQLPVLGYIPATNLRGWRQFPNRIIGFFNERKTTRWIGNETLIVVENKVLPFKINHDEFLGDSFIYTEKEWSDKQKQETNVPDIPWLLASKLFIFSKPE